MKSFFQNFALVVMLGVGIALMPGTTGVFAQTSDDQETDSRQSKAQTDDTGGKDKNKYPVTGLSKSECIELCGEDGQACPDYAEKACQKYFR